MTVRAWLTGRTSDLEILARHFDGRKPTVGRGDDDNFYLASDPFDDLFDQGDALHEAAKCEIALVNGITSALEQSFQPVELTGRFDDDSGRRHGVVFAELAIGVTATASVTATVNGKEVLPPPSQAPELVAVARDHPDATEALSILTKAKGDAGWADLYKVFEIIRENVGGQPRLIEKQWKTKIEISAFTASANSPHVSGSAARHARMQAGKPQHTMSLSEGRAMISDLLIAWLQALAVTP
ncbi:hypothetical protein [Amycolatopsis circi]|uniref:hypothetical protein n=1 Tax=Amycolatopsis circi TaxID=871959 RepID=UPI0013BEA568|nr:hypothetical protein [Amycolatopsis circi]